VHGACALRRPPAHQSARSVTRVTQLTCDWAGGAREGAGAAIEPWAQARAVSMRLNSGTSAGSAWYATARRRVNSDSRREPVKRQRLWGSARAERSAHRSSPRSRKISICRHVRHRGARTAAHHPSLSRGAVARCYSARASARQQDRRTQCTSWSKARKPTPALRQSSCSAQGCLAKTALC
jgi:hypothetical protein